MRLNEFHKTISAQQINENMASMFGQKLNLESFTLEQLEDARNKLRTRLSQFESSSNYNAVYEDEEYSKNKMFLDVLNNAIEERFVDEEIEFTTMEQMVLDKVVEGSIEFKELPEALKKKCKEASSKSSDQLSEKSPEGWEGTVKAMKKHDEIDNPWALAHWMKGKGYKSHKKESMGESVIKEGEEEKAELIMAARDMVDRITSWMEDTANMQAESMLELIDSIRDELGADLAMEFESVTKPALAAVYTSLESSRTQLTSAVGLLTGEGGPDMMGMNAGMNDMGGMDAGMDAGMDGMEPELDAEDEFAADQAAAGGEEAVGRATRESVEYSRKLGTILAQKKK
jgi:bacterioferritin (cytochrome b1)